MREKQEPNGWLRGHRSKDVVRVNSEYQNETHSVSEGAQEVELVDIARLWLDHCASMQAKYMAEDNALSAQAWARLAATAREVIGDAS